MSTTPSRAFLALASSLLLTAVLGETVTALNTAPAINLRRITSLYQAVWPGDFNGDRVIDLVGSDDALYGGDGAGTGAVRIALGNGDGSFRATVDSPFAGRVLAVADFNHDAKLDVVVAADWKVQVLAGNGDGTLAAQHPIEGSGFDAVNVALVADFDGDGHLDVALNCHEATYSPELRFFAGRGDFSFEPTAKLVVGITNAVAADFNRDGRPDIATVGEGLDTVTIHLNQGAFVFTASDIPLDKPHDVATADVDGDGHLDLVVAAREVDPALGGSRMKQATAGYAYVLAGGGDGTFGLPARYAAAPGAVNVIVDDFTRDGILDIATSNWSSLYVEDCAPGWKTWDSVSILPGRGDGTFAHASSFSLGNQLYPEIGRFRNTATSLNAADLNGDGAADIVASQGAILINMPADPNWAPKVNAGADQTSQLGQITLRVAASDVDQDMLTYRWSDSAGTAIPAVPTPCVSVTPGIHTFTVTVSDGHDHDTSDSVTYTIGDISPPAVSITAPKSGDSMPATTPVTIKWTATSAATITRFDLQSSTSGGAYWSPIYACIGLSGTARECRWNAGSAADQVMVRVYATDRFGQIGWAESGIFRIQNGSSYPWWHGEQDIGAVSAPGSGSVDWDSGVSTITGSGSDIWGTADAFHYAYEQRTGPFEITVRVNSLEAAHAWAKAGLMIRETLSAGSRHVSLFATPGKGVAFQRRMVTDGASVHTPGPPTTAPVWLKLARTATSVQAFYRKHTTDFWTPLAAADTADWPADLYFGLAVTSHADGTLATATFSRPATNPTGGPDLWGDEPGDVFGGWGPLAPWSGRRIGTTSGAASWNPAVITVTGGGADIWGTADGFHYVYVPVNGNAAITARVRSVQNTHAWAKAGLMFRESLTSTSKHVMAVVTPGKGVAMQYRASAGGLSANVALAPGTAPTWLHLRRSSDSITAWTSSDYVTWTKLGTVNVAMTADVFVGMAVTSHDTAATAQAIFDDVLIVR